MTALSILLLTNILQAKDNDIECNYEGTQMEMNQCAYQEYQKADKELNSVYKKLRKARKDDKLFLTNLKKAQRAWLKFRDAQLEAVFTCKSGDIRECFGSMYNLSYHTSNRLLIEARVKTLKSMLADASM